jgi:uncharacterized membrane protein YfcA
MHWDSIADILRPELVAIMAATLVAAFVRGMAGFGAALILTPVFSAFFGPAVAVPTLGLVDFTMGSPMALRAFRRCQWREVLPLALAAIVTLPLGVWLLAVASPLVLRIAMSLFVLLAVAALWSGWRYSGQPGLPTTLAVGAAAGVTTGAIGMGGPPVVVFWLAGQADAAQARANTVAFFGVVGVVTLANYFWRGLVTPQVLALTLVLLPLYGLGLFLGSRAFRILSEQTFRRIAFSLIAATAVATLFAALRQLIP